MVNGSLRCLGSGQHLKQRYGDGYEVDIKLNFTLSSMSLLVNQLQEAGLISLDSPTPSSPLHDLEAVPGEGTAAAVAATASISPTKKESHIFFKTRLACDLEEVCRVLMEPNRIKLIVPNGEGGSIYDMKHADGFVNLHTFLEWWIAQDDAVRLEGFMAQHFPGTVLLERSTAHSFRFRIPTKEMSLASIFRHFEEAKSRLNIEDYSVGQTTLEQIFNQFAASQDNPEVSAASAAASATRSTDGKRESFGVSKEPIFARTNSSVPLRGAGAGAGTGS
jgi:ATP-binding cassette, subfamily A (ABC1), member 3